MVLQRLRLSVDDPRARQGLDATVTALLAAGHAAPKLAIELNGEALPDPIVGALIANLRRLREVGGEIAIEPVTAQLRAALSLYGLDRIFRPAA